MDHILLTNDDGIDSPALVPFATELERLGTVSIVVPSKERSWVSKAITRHEPLTVGTERREGLVISTVDGYPADCTQIGIHVDHDAPPRLVVSGLNIGYNHGRAFLMSSGTVGAAFEAALGGVPAVAVSAGIIGDWPAWSAHAWSEASAGMWTRLSGVAVDIVERLLDHGFPPTAQVVSINLPGDATRATERRITRLADSAYDQLFAPREDGTYRHVVESHRIVGDPVGTDVQAAHDGVIAVTPLCLPTSSTIPDGLAAALGAVPERTTE